jgi:tetrahydromethanopterin S-methyltransferase subunit H
MGMGLVDGDVNGSNFIVDRSSGHVRMIGFEHAEEFGG